MLTRWKPRDKYVSWPSDPFFKCTNMIMDEREAQTSKKPVVNQRREREGERERERKRDSCLKWEDCH